MTGMRIALRLYVLSVVLAGVAAAGALVPQAMIMDPLAIALLAFATIAQLRPIHLTQKMKITVEDSATFAAALLLPAPAAFVVASVATLAAALVRRRSPWFEIAFNAAVSGLSTAAGAFAFATLGGSASTVPSYALAMAAAAAAMYLTNTTLVDIAAALQLRRDPLSTWWLVHRRDIPQSSALYALGALMAMVADVHPIAIALFALPVVAVFVAARETAQLRTRTREAIIEFARLIDLRDRYTHGHSQRVAALAERVALQLRLDPSQVTLIRDAALLHDLGKIHTPEHVLRKPGPLDAHEQDEMRLHAEVGADLLRKLHDFWEGAHLIRAHHERYDGTGYPLGLAGAEVPLEAGVIAVADAWDAMTSDRPYRSALSTEQALAQLRDGRGTQWAPVVVDALLSVVGGDAIVAAPAVLASSA